MRINRKSSFKTPSRTSPKNGRRGCLCADNTYSTRCCDGSLQAQGIGVIQCIPPDAITLEDGSYLLQEDNSKLLIEN
jgi:hypothetical protein